MNAVNNNQVTSNLPGEAATLEGNGPTLNRMQNSAAGNNFSACSQEIKPVLSMHIGRNDQGPTAKADEVRLSNWLVVRLILILEFFMRMRARSGVTYASSELVLHRLVHQSADYLKHEQVKEMQKAAMKLPTN